jgi:ATP-binding cassette subfamily C protein
VNLHLALFRDLVLRLRWRFPVLTAWTVLVGISESLSMALMLPLLNSVGITAGVAQGGTGAMLERALGAIGAQTATQVLALIAATAAVQAGLSIGLNIWSTRLARHYQSRRQLEMFTAFMQAQWRFLAARRAGDLTNAIVTESERLGRAFAICFSILASLMITAVYVVVSLFLTWKITVCLIGLGLVTALAMTRLYKRSFAVGESLAPMNAEVQSLLEQHFAGAKYIKAVAGEARAAERLDLLLKRLEDANVFATSLPGTVRALLEFFALVALAVTIVFGSISLGVAAGDLVIVLALFGRLFPRMTALQAQIHYLNGNVHAIEAIDRLQEAALSVAEPPSRTGAALSLRLPTMLEMRGVRVELDDRVVLDNVDITLPVPGLLAIVGRSGAGKSTLIHSLLGLLDIRAGSIRLGEHQLGVAPLRQWRHTIGYVPQETILFHASIADNLRLANPDASMSELEAAASRAHALDFIRALPEGFETVIGDQGVKLSGGQRQRVGMARALLNNPYVLMLDEPTSALDPASEADFMRTILELRRQMGILLITHRSSLAEAADSICVLDAGRVVEHGSWHELIARRGFLHAIAAAGNETSSFKMLSA